jgi:hypothetical protein
MPKTDPKPPHTETIDSEDHGTLALTFITASDRRVKVIGLVRAQLTDGWVRGGDAGENLAHIQSDCTIVFAEMLADQPDWCHRFADAARAIGGRFTHVEIAEEKPDPAAHRFRLEVDSANEANPDLHIATVELGQLTAASVISARGLLLAGEPTERVTFNPDTNYWVLERRNYSDVLIERP